MSLITAPDLLSIGAFAQRTRLSHKALRLYAELGLLPPARIDPATGYRFYGADQVDRARLIGLLRRLDMPLASSTRTPRSRRGSSERARPWPVLPARCASSTATCLPTSPSAISPSRFADLYPSSVVGVPLDRVPTPARTAWLALRHELKRVLGDDLIAMWAHGGTIAVDDPVRPGDLDTYVIVSRRPDEAMARAIEDAHEALADEHGVEWDAWYVLADGAHGSDPPRHAWHEGRRDTSWAINRAHWLAGRYANLHGAEPAELVPAPAWEELVSELDRELEHIERHVMEGDTDPYEATYAFLNGSRILHSLDTHDVGLSKRAAGTWALDHLPARWHRGLQAALRTYDARPAVRDAALLADEMGAFVAFVRERMPPGEDRRADAVPRWSGC